MKIKLFCIVFIVSLVSLSAQETDYPGAARDWKTFPWSLGAGIEYGQNTRENYAVGYSVAIDRYLDNPYTALGIRGTMYNDYNTVTASEAELLFRLYFFDLNNGAFFAQLGFGAAFYREDDRQINTYIMDCTAGYRYYVQTGFFQGLYFEPFLRTGYPFEWGFGLFVGHWFNF